jgi:hypothetical protein
MVQIDRVKAELIAVRLSIIFLVEYNDQNARLSWAIAILLTIKILHQESMVCRPGPYWEADLYIEFLTMTSAMRRGSIVGLPGS